MAAVPDGQNPLFPGQQIRVFLSDDMGGDIAPELGQFITYTFDVGELPAETIIPLERDSESDLRMVTHNVLFDNPWGQGNESRFGRQRTAVSPDIFNFQEIFEHTAEDAAMLVGNWVDLEPGHAVRHVDNVTVSRYPIVGSWTINGNLATLVDVTEKLGSQMLIINADKDPQSGSVS